MQDDETWQRAQKQQQEGPFDYCIKRQLHVTSVGSRTGGRREEAPPPEATAHVLSGPQTGLPGGTLLGLLASRYLNFLLRENVTAALNNLATRNRDDKSIILMMFPKALETFFISYSFPFILINEELPHRACGLYL